MDLSTQYLGLDLPHPFMPGSCPLADDLDAVKELEDAGAAAITLRSLFEEQIVSEEMAMQDAMEGPAESFAEALTYFADSDHFVFGPDEYLAHLQQVKQAVAIPVVASLNGTRLENCVEYARQIASAGADALELNLYFLATDAGQGGGSVERNELEMVRSIAGTVEIPVAVKLHPFYSSLPNMALRFHDAGASGLVLFNRFYQPDIDIEHLEVDRTLHLSDPSELLLRLRWLAILYSQVETSLAVTGGVHSAEGALKAIMAGADVVQVVSALLQHGPGRLATIRQGVADWLEAHEYESLDQARGSMSLRHCPDALAYERANYADILQSWRKHTL